MAFEEQVQPWLDKVPLSATLGLQLIDDQVSVAPSQPVNVQCRTTIELGCTAVLVNSTTLC
eukprot:COSAG05_NODE_660_length_8054_cov_3.180264_6_plen_61_part_00